MALQNSKDNLSLSEMFAQNVQKSYSHRSDLSGRFLVKSSQSTPMDKTLPAKSTPKPTALKKAR
jgi:hypothetical protein